MKKSLFWALSLTFALLSCSKELQETNDAQASGTNPEPADLKVWTVNAAIADPADEDAKANLDETTLQVLWQSGDVIGLVDAEGTITPATLATGAGTGVGTFSYTAEQEIVVSYAFYPYQETATVSGTTLSINLASSQNYVPAGGIVKQNTLIMVAKPSTGNLLFKNCCAIAQFNIKGTDCYARKAFLYSPWKNICGDGSVNMSLDAPVFTTPTIRYEGADSSKEMYVLGNINGENSSNRIHINPATAETIYFVLPAGTYDHLSMEILADQNEATTSNPIRPSYSTTKSVTLTAGKIKPLNMEVTIPTASTDLSDGGKYANCYLVEGTTGGAYCFAPYKRNVISTETEYNTFINSDGYATVLWQTNADLLNNVIYDRVGQRIHFKVKSGESGNAVIALFNRKNIIQWSWHIWVTETAVETRTFGTSEFMDRNVGATVAMHADETDARAVGMFYQWGRKDPFPGVADFSATGYVNSAPVYPNMIALYTSGQDGIPNEAWTTHRPFLFVRGTSASSGHQDWLRTQENYRWGGTINSSEGTAYYTVESGSVYYNKSNADPCPYGYRVPQTQDYQKPSNSDNISTRAKAVGISCHGYLIKDDNNKDFFLPCGGEWQANPNSSTNNQQIQHVGTNVWCWLKNSHGTKVNTDYYGSYMNYRNGAAGGGNAQNGGPRKRREGANVRCVKWNESNY